MANIAAYFGDRRIFALLIIFIVALWFIIVNNPGLRQGAQIYLYGALIVLAGLPMLRMILR